MTYEMEYSARLFACGAMGAEAEPPSRQVDWETVVQRAVEQGVTYTAALAVKRSQTGCPEHIKERLTASQRGAAISNYVRTEAILGLVGEMEKAGIPSVIIKGIDAARCYASPECRVSSDTDILVPYEDESRALGMLRERGFVTERRKKSDYHTICSHSEMGMVELHIRLLHESYEKEFSGSGLLIERAIPHSVMSSIYGKPYRALEPTDGMLYLVYHMLKHLITGGTSLRMIMDCALYAKTNKDLIDREKCAAELTGTGYSRAARLLFGTAVRYLGCAAEDFPLEPITDAQGTEAIMTDLEEGGWTGYKTQSNDAVWAWKQYIRENAEKLSDRSSVDNIRSGGRLVLSGALRPGKVRMLYAYPVLQKHMALYPLCYVHRLFCRGIPWLIRGGMKKVVVPGGAEVLSDTARDRLELYRRLELID